jgi:hypothetical protein
VHVMARRAPHCEVVVVALLHLRDLSNDVS